MSNELFQIRRLSDKEIMKMTALVKILSLKLEQRTENGAGFKVAQNI